MVEVALVIMPKLLLTVLPIDWLGVLLLPILEGVPVSRPFSLSLDVTRYYKRNISINDD